MYAKFSLVRSWKTFFIGFYCIFQISKKIFCKIKKLSYTNFYRNLITWFTWSMALNYPGKVLDRNSIRSFPEYSKNCLWVNQYWSKTSFQSISISISDTNSIRINPNPIRKKLFIWLNPTSIGNKFLIFFCLII